MRILGISGSLRRDSYNSMLLRAAAELLPPGAELEVYDGLKAVPPYDADDDGDFAPAAVVGASTGMFGAVWAQAETRKILQTIGARVVDRELPVSEADERFPGGRLEDPDLRELYAEILAEVVESARLREEALAQRAA